MALLGIRFDLRVPEFAATTHARQYAACLDMCEWADGLGFDFVTLSEHHGSPDGYMSAPLTLAGAVVGRTTRVSVSVAASLVPLHDPVRLAEQLATLSLASGGRVNMIAGAGYREEEFAMAGVDRRRRGRLVEEHVGVMQQAWSGEPFEWQGRTILVTPKPEIPPLVMVGGSTEIAAQRAARLRCGFSPSIGDPELARIYEEECAAQGFDGGFVSLPRGPGAVIVSDDPDATWEAIGANLLHDAQTYAAWQTPGQRSAVDVPGARTWQDVRASGVYRVVTPQECVALADEIGAVLLHPLVGGVAPEPAWESLRLFEEQVLPKLTP